MGRVWTCEWSDGRSCSKFPKCCSNFWKTLPIFHKSCSQIVSFQKKEGEGWGYFFLNLTLITPTPKKMPLGEGLAYFTQFLNFQNHFLAKFLSRDLLPLSPSRGFSLPLSSSQACPYLYFPAGPGFVLTFICLLTRDLALPLSSSRDLSLFLIHSLSETCPYL